MAAYAARYPASARPVDEMTAALTGGPRTPARPAAAAAAAGTSGADGGGRPVAVITRPAGPGRDDQDDDEDDYSDEEENVLDEYLQTDDPTPGLEAGIDDPIEPEDTDEPFEFDGPEAVTPDEARTLFAGHLAKLRADGKTELAARDFRPIMRPGMGRAWIHARLNEYVDRGDLLHDPDTRTYQFPKAA
jgi:hypothetical protein